MLAPVENIYEEHYFWTLQRVEIPSSHFNSFICEIIISKHIHTWHLLFWLLFIMPQTHVVNFHDFWTSMSAFRRIYFWVKIASRLISMTVVIYTPAHFHHMCKNWYNQMLSSFVDYQHTINWHKLKFQIFATQPTAQRYNVVIESMSSCFA